MLQDEYYVIKRENKNNYPLFAWAQSSREYNRGKPVEYTEPLKFTLQKPVQRKFEWADFHRQSGGPAVSGKIVEALLPLKLYGVQFVPAGVSNPKDPSGEPRDYWFVHIWNRIECLDRERSELDLYSDGDIAGIEKMVFNEKALKKIKANKRMIFTLAEDITVNLVHESVKEVIESVEPTGVRFFNATEWGSDRIF